MLNVEIEGFIVGNIEGLFLAEVGRVLEEAVIEVRLVGQPPQDFFFGWVRADVLVLELQGAVELDFGGLHHLFQTIKLWRLIFISKIIAASQTPFDVCLAS